MKNLQVVSSEMKQLLYQHTRKTETCMLLGEVNLIHLFSPQYNFYPEGKVNLQFGAHKLALSASYLLAEAFALSELIFSDLIL